MAKFTVIVTDNRHGDYGIEEKILKECGAELVIENCITEEDVIRSCRNADGILLDMAPMPRQVVQKMEKVRVISRYGVGMDNVDVAACTEKNIYLANVPDYCAEDVSDLALAYILGGMRQIVLKDRLIRRGQWNTGNTNIFRIKGKTLAIIGYGRIGKCLHRKVRTLGFEYVLVHDPLIDQHEIEKNGGVPVCFEDALSKADIISLHLPVTERTVNIIDESAFSLMKKTAVFINTSRGALVDHDALVHALKSGGIAFAGLDNHAEEPIPAEDALLGIENCALTDHTGFNTQESIVELKTKAAENIRAVLSGGIPAYWVNCNREYSYGR